ncbi:MAG: alpha/beta hydrolase [Alphaproteobacteria bacterium]|nr:MAG: alpha/beta hydrolase [Alphaproteobacteria bacterium]
MIAKKNKSGFQQFGRIVPGLQIPEFKCGLKWRGADLQTMRNMIVGPAASLGPDFERVNFDLGAGKSLAAAYHPSSRSGILPLIVIIHGMAGDEQSPNVVSSAAYFGACGYPVLRLNLRGAGPSAKTSVGPYHGGLTEDLEKVIDQISTRDYGAGIVLYGISLGGNMMLKYLGERGSDAPVRAAVAVSAPLNLKAVQLRIMAPRNRMYHNYLLLGMKNYIRQTKEHHDQGLLDKAQAAKSLFEFDDHVTAPANGMAGAEEYYRLHSAKGFVDHIGVPTLLIHARNDPWIPVADFEEREWHVDGAVSLLITDDGGHVGFHARDHKIPWQERVAVQYLGHVL